MGLGPCKPPLLLHKTHTFWYTDSHTHIARTSHTRAPQDLVQKLLERKPAKRLGMLQGRAADVKRHKWFDGVDWDSLEARRTGPPRRPKDSDSAKRLKELGDAERKGAGPGAPGGGRASRETADEQAEAEEVFSAF